MSDCIRMTTSANHIEPSHAAYIAVGRSRHEIEAALGLLMLSQLRINRPMQPSPAISRTSSKSALTASCRNLLKEFLKEG